MFGVAMILVTLAAIFGVLVFFTACVLLLTTKLRTLGLAAMAGGSLGAVIAFSLFAVFVLVVEAGREPLLSQVTGVFAATGFGAGGVIGAVAYLLFRILRSPNRWVDRHRVGHAP